LTLGESIYLKDNRLYLQPKELFMPIKESYPTLEKKYLWVRTKQKAAPLEENTAFDQIFEYWRARSE